MGKYFSVVKDEQTTNFDRFVNWLEIKMIYKDGDKTQAENVYILSCKILKNNKKSPCVINTPFYSKNI